MARPVNPAGLAGVFGNIQALQQGQQRLDIAGRQQSMGELQQAFKIFQQTNNPQVLRNFMEKNRGSLIEGVDLESLGGGTFDGLQQPPTAPPGLELSGAGVSGAGATSFSFARPTGTDPITSSDADFYTTRGYTEDEARTILDKKFGLDRGLAGRDKKDIRLDLSAWQTILNKTREVGVLGQFGDIYDQDTFDLAEQSIEDLRSELGDVAAGQLPTTPSAETLSGAPPSSLIPEPPLSQQVHVRPEKTSVSPFAVPPPGEPFKRPPRGTKVTVTNKNGKQRTVSLGALKFRLNAGDTIVGNDDIAAYQNQSGQPQNMGTDVIGAGEWGITFDGGKTWQKL